MGCQSSSQYCQEKCNAIVWSRYGQTREVSGYIGSWAVSAISGHQCSITAYPQSCSCSCSGVRLSQPGRTMEPNWYFYYTRPTFSLKADGCVVGTSSGSIRAEVDDAASGSSCKSHVSPLIFTQKLTLLFFFLFFFLKISVDNSARGSRGGDSGGHPPACASCNRWLPHLPTRKAFSLCRQCDRCQLSF